MVAEEELLAASLIHFRFCRGHGFLFAKKADCATRYRATTYGVKQDASAYSYLNLSAVSEPNLRWRVAVVEYG